MNDHSITDFFIKVKGKMWANPHFFNERLANIEKLKGQSRHSSYLRLLLIQQLVGLVVLRLVDDVPLQQEIEWNLGSCSFQHE